MRLECSLQRSFQGMVPVVLHKGLVWWETGPLQAHTHPRVASACTLLIVLHLMLHFCACRELT